MDSLKQYQEFLNEIGLSLPCTSFCIGGKMRRGLFGNMIRRHDPIAFEVGFRDWRDNN